MPNDNEVARRLAKTLSTLYVDGQRRSAFDGTSDRETLLRRRKTKKKVSRNKNVKYVLRKTVGDVTSLYVCGWKPQCVKVLDLPAGASLENDKVILDNQGDDGWVLSLCYSLPSGEWVFQLWDPNFLINEYTESGLSGFIKNTVIGGYANYLRFYDAVYGNFFLYPVGFGQFIGNYCHDSSTVINSGPGGTPTSASAVGRIRISIDLATGEVKRFTHPTDTYSRVGTNPTTETIDWSGLEVFANFTQTLPSYTRATIVNSGLGGLNNDMIGDTRYVYRVNDDGTKAIGETLKERDLSSSGGGSVEYREDYYIYYFDGSQETLFPVIQQNPPLFAPNRFTAVASTSLGVGARYTDITNNGISFIETGQANPSASPPIPETTLYRIERATESRRVTVQLLEFDFTVRSSINVQVFPPDINEGETSNYGTVIAASYG